MTRAILRSIPLTPIITLGFLAAGAFTPLLLSADPWRSRVWLAGLVLTGAPVAWKTLKGMFEGNFAADVVAMLAIIGALLLGQPLAGLVVVLMQTGGEALDAYAVARASDAVKALEADSPRTAHRVVGERVSDIAADQIEPGDILLIRPGDLVPADGQVIDGASHVDSSRLTGEPLAVRVSAGARLLSGSINQEGALYLRAERRSQESQYAKIVDLVRTAQASKSPLQRTADQWAVWFTPLTLALCALTWFISHDWTRVLAVLVIATPCPLILAAPVAIIGGINRAASRSIIVRNGGALEAIARINSIVFDKTGTLTVGHPQVASIRISDHADEQLLLAQIAAVEQGSAHLLARVLVAEAEARKSPILRASAIHETSGRGVRGVVDETKVAVGSASYILEQFRESETVVAAVSQMNDSEDNLRAWAATSQGAVARVDFEEALRPDIHTMLDQLRVLGLSDIHLLSGDKSDSVATIAHEVGISQYEGDLLASDKVERVKALESDGKRVLMVGDGTNDAPALSAATVGIALAGHGGGIVAEAADIVLLIDEPSRIPEAVRIGRRTLHIARESIAVGLGLSVVGMGFAAAGYLSPVAGALIQEVIDVAVIVNALRVARG